MGGTSSEETTQTQTTTPTIGGGLLGSVLAKTQQINPDLTVSETNALDRLSAAGAAGNAFAPAIGNIANTLLGGGGPDRTGLVNDAYAQYRAAIDPTARGDYLDPNKNPFFSATTSGIADDVMARVRAEYAGAGRDPSGAGSYAGNVGSEVAKALAPTYANVYSTERGRQLDAITGMYGAGGQTAGLLSNLDQTRLGNMQAGVGAADAANTAQMWGPQAVLAAEAMRRGIPLETLQAQYAMALPAAQAFATRTGNSKTEKEMSGAEQYATIGKGTQAYVSSAMMMF